MQRYYIRSILGDIAESSSLEKPILEVHGNTILSLLDCKTREEATTIMEGRPRYLFEARVAHFKQKWSSMSAQEQAKALDTIGIAESTLAHHELLLLKEFVADDTLLWALPSMRLACSHVIETRAAHFQDHMQEVDYTLLHDIIHMIKQIAYAPTDAAYEALVAQMSALTHNPSQQPSNSSLWGQCNIM